MWAPWQKPVDPKEQVRKWKADLRGEGRKLERQVRHIQAEEVKVKKSIKDAAKRGDTASAKVLAKELVRSRKVVNRLQISRVQLNSVVMQMQENYGARRARWRAGLRLAGRAPTPRARAPRAVRARGRAGQAKVMGHLQKSADIMRVMNNLIKLPEIAQTMQALQREMVKAGVIEDLVDAAMDQDDDELEDEAEEEVEKVLVEITSDMFQKAGAVPLQTVRAASGSARRSAASQRARAPHAPCGAAGAQVAKPEAAHTEAEEAADSEEVLAMQARLESLKAA